jgi:hypothetical protein
MSDTDDESDEVFIDEQQPHVRPSRMILGSIVALVGTVLALASWSFLLGPRQRLKDQQLRLARRTCR